MRNDVQRLFAVAVAICLVTCSLPSDGFAQRVARVREAASPEQQEALAASRMLKQAQDLLLANERDRAVRMLEVLLEQYPTNDIRYDVYLTLGRHYLEANSQLQAINYLRHLRDLRPTDGSDMSPEHRDRYLEGLYLTGQAYFQMRQYEAAFPVLRRITNDFPNTVWANQAYYYIGISHFAQQNWTKAIEALSKVGTFVDPDSPATEYVEAGRRFYVKVSDTDLPVLYRLGDELEVTVTTRSGDRESVRCIPLSATGETFIGSIPTVLGPPTVDDGSLQVVGGDEITTTYVDRNTLEGSRDVQRIQVARVVSTAALAFTLGDYQTPTSTSFVGQPTFVTLHDADLSVSPKPDEVTVRILSRFVEHLDDEPDAGGISIDRLLNDEQKRYVVRDELEIVLRESPGEHDAEGLARSGRFLGQLSTVPMVLGQPLDRSDDQLTVAVGDELVASYVDELHIGGSIPRQVDAMVEVVHEIDSRPRPVQYVVPDPLVRAEKNIVESRAFLELARIFMSMGLKDGAQEQADEGIARVDEVIRSRTPLPTPMVQEAFKLKWDLYLAVDNYRQAIATCQLFNRLYPDSPFVDEALLQIGNAHLQEKDYDNAINVFQQILRLNVSNVKAEAQFRIAQAHEDRANARGGNQGRFSESAIAAYKQTAERYPDSPFAGEAISKLVDYYIASQDFPQANELLSQVFIDYPDAQFLDSMLLKWVMVAYRMGNYPLAAEKCEQLIFEYPSSRFAERAKQVLPQIQQRIGRGG